MGKKTIQAVILDMSSKCLRKNEGCVKSFSSLINFFFFFCAAGLMNIDVSGIASLEELHKNLASSGKEVWNTTVIDFVSSYECKLLKFLIMN